MKIRWNQEVPSPTTLLPSQQLVIDTRGKILGQCLLRVDEKGVVQRGGRGGLGGGDRSGRRRACRDSRIGIRHGRERQREVGRDDEKENKKGGMGQKNEKFKRNSSGKV